MTLVERRFRLRSVRLPVTRGARPLYSHGGRRRNAPPAMEMEQIELLPRADRLGAARDPFAIVVRDHQRYVAAQLLRRGVPESDTDDVAQEVFLAVHAELATFAGRSLRAWLAGICRNKANDHRRKHQRRRELFALHAWLLDVDVDDAHEQLVRSRTAARVRHSLSRLPASQRAVLALHEIEERSMREVAALLACPLDTAYTRHRTGRERMRAMLARDERQD